MIVKLRVPQYVGSVVKSGGWKYVDGVERVTTMGPILNDDGEDFGPRVFRSYDEVKDYVAHAWGDHNEREYAFELWPEWPREGGVSRFLTVAYLYLVGGGMVLAVLTEDCYLLGDNGQTVDRLCSSGMAFPK